MFVRLTRSAPWLSTAGVIVLLAGLGWDAILHRLDPGLAEREGVFTLTNPGHLLFAAGIVLTIAGTLLFLIERAARRPGLSLRRRAALVAPVAGLLALAGVSLSFAMASPGGLTGHTHSHTVGGAQIFSESTPHTHDPATGATEVTRTPNGVVHAHGAEVPITAEQLAAAMKLWDDTKTGTQRLQEFKQAQAEGYRQITPWLGGLAHFHNQAYFAAGHTLDPAKPEELIYLRSPRGAIRLVGVMYLAQPGQAGPRVGGPLTSWHAHDNLCYSTGNLMVVALADAAGKCPKGTVYNGVTPEMLHVWLVENPNGIFSEDMSPTALVALLNGNGSH